MSGNIIEDTLKRIKEAYDRGYDDGFRRGAESEKKAGLWHVPEARPQHDEWIVALAKPYDRKTQRYCKKHGISFLRIEGLYIDGETIRRYISAEESDEYDEEEFPDAILVSKRTAVAWENVILWISAELPEGFALTEDNDG